jgi:hypothetical protein
MRGAKPPSERERGWGPASSEKDDGNAARKIDVSTLFVPQSVLPPKSYVD